MIDFLPRSPFGECVFSALSGLFLGASRDSSISKHLRQIEVAFTPIDQLERQSTYVDTWLVILHDDLLKKLGINSGEKTWELGPPMRVWHALFGRLAQAAEQGLPFSEEDRQEAKLILELIEEHEVCFTDDDIARRCA
jgi:hypothetical protein